MADGTAFELTPSGGGWTESILHNFGSGNDGLSPYAGVVLDTAGNVYGTTLYGGNGAECDEQLRNGLPAHAFIRRVGGECPG